jgi:c-di-GMP-binding flagellar brake protein YcgR
MSTHEQSKKVSVGSAAGRKERRARRLRINCRMFFFGENDFEGEARVLDISSGGCCAESGIPVEVGMELRLSLFLPDQRWPVKIEGAVVRWVAEQKFGLEFFKLLPAVQERIRQFIRNHKGDEA